MRPMGPPWLTRARIPSWDALSSRLRRVVPKGQPGRTILSVDGQWLKVLHLAGPWSSQTVNLLLAHRIEGMSDAEVVGWLKQTCEAKGLEAGRVLVSNPSHLTTTRLFTLPSTDPAEIRAIVELQAEKHTPYAKEEILVDFLTLETDGSGYSRILLALSHQDVVHRGLKLVEEMGWPLERVGFELEGLVNWSRGVSHGSSDRPTLVAEVDGETTTLVVLHRGQPSFHRSLNVGITHLLTNSAEGSVKLLTEFQRSLEAFEAEGFNLAVGSVVLTGQAARVPGLQDRLQQGLDLPTSIVSPFERCPVLEAVMVAQEPLNQVSFASLVGLALKPSKIDLTPTALKLHRVFEARARTLVGLGCQGLAVLLLVACLVIGKAHKNERYHAQLLAEYQTTLSQTQDMEQRLEQLQFVKQWLQGRGQFLEAVAELTQHTPPVIQWESLAFTKGEGLIVKGVSTEMPQVFDFAAELKTSARLSQVEAKRVSKRKVGDQDVTEFEIVCSFASLGPEG